VAWQRLAQRLSQLPLVLAGPILRRTEFASVTVWIALKQERRVTLRVYRGSGPSRVEVLSGSRRTARIGEFLHVVAVEAVTSTDSLSEAETYYYDLEFGGGETLGSQGIVSVASDASARQRVFAYEPSDLPSFALPPKDISRLRLVHGSCRKPHGQGSDALAALDPIIAASLARPAASPEAAPDRPHMLLLTGDQIYADDVADALLEALTDAGDTLLGWPQAEQLPPEGKKASDYAPGKRAAAVLAAGFTSGLPHAPDRRKSHLLSLGEFCAMYLFVWSDVLWPPEMPDRGSRGEQKNLGHFRETLPFVRRALANVPSYMILDDHEVSDDFYMNREWCYRVFGRPEEAAPDEASPKLLGQRIIQNGLTAYAIFQAWGNTPSQFSEQGPSGEPGRKLLEAVSEWRGDQASAAARCEIARRVGLPSGRLAAAANPGGTASLERLDGHLVWHYSVAMPGYPFEILVLDCRTVRGYPGAPGTFPALMNREAFRAQIVSPSPPTPAQVRLTIVVSPTPWIGLTWVEHWQRKARRRKGLQWKHDTEAWGLNRTEFQTMLTTVTARRSRVVVLSGDVHYGFASRLGYWASRPFGIGEALGARRVANVAQLTSSSFKNQTSSVLPKANTDQLHIKGFSPSRMFGLALKNNPEDWAGWAGPAPPSEVHRETRGFLSWRGSPSFHADGLTVLNVSRRPASQEDSVQEDWLYRIQFLPGAKSETTLVPDPALSTAPADKVAPVQSAQRLDKARAKELKGKQGVEIVGLNNLGEVLFDWPSGAPPTVTQNLFWGITQDGLAQVKTTYRVPLDTAEAAFEPLRREKAPP
jgi:hypothetical protein